ncbi:hypothetical protein F5Y18DRAFT_384309 [Xylariaceae sp. FL1019]|nr:hypothetical protein F5Y18DRAFT_384309 [Xylariaceae sp. FL1019]
MLVMVLGYVVSLICQQGVLVLCLKYWYFVSISEIVQHNDEIYSQTARRGTGTFQISHDRICVVCRAPLPFSYAPSDLSGICDCS